MVERAVCPRWLMISRCNFWIVQPRHDTDGEKASNKPFAGPEWRGINGLEPETWGSFKRQTPLRTHEQTREDDGGAEDSRPRVSDRPGPRYGTSMKVLQTSRAILA